MRNFILAVALLLPLSAQADLHRNVTVTDGDSILIPGDGGYAAMIRVRALGYDAPESNARCAAERALAYRAKLRLMELSARGLNVRGGFKSDMYGRPLAIFRVPDPSDVPGYDGKGREIRDIFVEEGLARAYDGKGARRPWCDAAGNIIP